MDSLKSNRWLIIAIPMVSGFFLCSQPAHAQLYNPNSVYGSVAQQMAQGLLNPGQAQDMMNRQNNYAARAAKLLRNDGGVLTPNDANKLGREAAKDAQQDANYVNGNAGGTGVGGLLGNLFGLGTPTPITGSDGTYPYLNSPYVGSGIAPYNSLYSPYCTTGYTAPYTAPYVSPVNNYVGNNAAWQAQRAQEHAWHEQQRQRWAARHGF